MVKLKMQIKIKKDEIDETQSVQGNPVILTKYAENNVLLFNGETTVIGGLTKEKTQNSEDGVPALKDIPVLGWLFKNTSRADEKEDLLIFVTPHILQEKDFSAIEKIPTKSWPQADSPSMPEATPQ
jgi:type IV pilus assembly protein PilQ